jgi:hypothetical protein
VAKKFNAKLSVNKKDVEMNQFVEQFLAHTVVGGVETLRDVDNINTVNVSIEKGEVTILVNGNNIPLTPFPNDVILGTLTGLVSVLKDVGKVEDMAISVKTK